MDINRWFVSTIDVSFFFIGNNLIHRRPVVMRMCILYSGLFLRGGNSWFGCFLTFEVKFSWIDRCAHTCTYVQYRIN